MRGIIIIICTLHVTVAAVLAQATPFDDLSSRVKLTTNDTLQLIQYDSLSDFYSESNPDSVMYYARLAQQKARSLGFKINEAFSTGGIGYAFLNKGDYPAALQALLSALNIANNPQNENSVVPLAYRNTMDFNPEKLTPREYRLQMLGMIHFSLGVLYESMKDLPTALDHIKSSIAIGEKMDNPRISAAAHMSAGRIFGYRDQSDSAIYHASQAYEVIRKAGLVDFMGSGLLNLGRTYLEARDTAGAITYFRQAIEVSEQTNYYRGVVATSILLTGINLRMHQYDSARVFARRALESAEDLQFPDLLRRSYTNSANYFQAVHMPDSAVKYLNLEIGIKDSLFNSDQTRLFVDVQHDAERRQEELLALQKDYRDKLQKYALLGGMVIFLITAFILWRNNRQKQRSNVLLQQQRDEIKVQKNKVEDTLEELKSAQIQLIHSEKMASLGEMTAGIAHEIQNPLNFVNNFSEVNKELLEEIQQAIATHNFEEVRSLTKHLIDNEEKITFHGKRADAIVKSMLMHSRASSGEKELTDLNALVDEYLRLSYHGLRAKDKSFNAEIHTDFDPTLPKVEVFPQDIGRVLLNLINNAFYAVSAKASATADAVSEKKTGVSDASVVEPVETSGPSTPFDKLRHRSGTGQYKPTVTVTTKNRGNNIEIRVKDNGNGISQEVLDKIFQPFFTTKPSGQGTGLGLSLSYDIVKAHGGELKVETAMGDGSEFTIVLPVMKK